MRALHFYKTYFPDTFGGIEQVINQIAQGAQKLGVTTEVLSLSKNGFAPRIEIDGHVSHRAKLDFQIASNDFSISAFSHFKKLAADADIVHYHFPWPFMDMVHFVTGIDKLTIVTYHSDIIRQKHLLKLYQPVQYRFLSSVDHIVTTSPNYAATSDVLKRYSNKVSVIPIGLDKTSYPVPTPARLAYWKSRLGEKFFLFVGMIRYYKGLHVLLEAARSTNYPIVIVGSGPLEAPLREKAKNLGLTEMQFLGALSEADKTALLTLCYGMVFPSHLRSEAFGVSLLEAAMFSKPMISCEIGTGTTYINVNGETGIVTPSEDATALRNAMQYLWEHPNEAKEMGRKAEARYWQCFTAQAMAESYVALYQRLISSHMKKCISCK